MPFPPSSSDPKFGAQKLDESGDIPEIRVKTAFNGYVKQNASENTK